ncbi:MAG: 4Fe-4S dicluster domain-containing protein [Desulfobacterota bacterium]|nr:4Fe-4S dicluster domain-containing protein [Thermodesulfobacteriota bacterium]
MIHAKDLDPGFKDLIAREPGGQHIKKCFACGTCTAGCPVRQITERYNPRKIIRMALLGMKKDVLSSPFIWLCSSCYTCYERCPQDVRIPELMNAIKNIAVREGHIPPPIKTQLELLSTFGRLLEISDFENEKRREFGLPLVQGRTEEIQKILKGLGLCHEEERGPV